MSRAARKRALTTIALVLAGGCLGWWFLHPRPTDRELIEELVAKAEHGIETKSTTEIMDCVAPDYHDQDGLTRTDIFRLAWRWQRTSGRADIVIEDYQLDITPPIAAGRFEVQFLLEAEGESYPPLHLHLGVDFQKVRRGWRKVWLVKAVNGHGVKERFEDFL